MDFIATAVDVFSVLLLIFVMFVGWKTVRSFRQSRQAVTESASLLAVIVNGLTSRIESSESIVNYLRQEFESVSNRSADLEGRQSNLQTGYLQILRYLQNALSNDKRLILELEQLKSRLTSIEQKPMAASDIPAQSAQTRTELSISGGDIMVGLTPTEQQTVEILRREGPKAAPELGRRVRKSREHMARLMKKLYMEGYVDRESNLAPFRYRLNEKVRQAFDMRTKPITATAPEKA